MELSSIERTTNSQAGRQTDRRTPNVHWKQFESKVLGILSPHPLDLEPGRLKLGLILNHDYQSLRNGFRVGLD